MVYYYSSNDTYPNSEETVSINEDNTPSLTTTLGKVELEDHYDIFFYECLLTIIGTNIKIQMRTSNLEGTLIGAKPDHIILDHDGKTFFIRIQEIVWIMPIN